MSWAFYPLSTMPAPCSVVWCRFPYVEDEDKPGPKSRPALVKRASYDQHGNPWIHVAYGTSQQIFRRGFNHFTIANLAELDFCGLYCATRFRLDRVAVLPWAEEFFSAAPGRMTPVMGRLSEHSVQLLKAQSMLRERFENAQQEPQLPMEDAEPEED